jgi:uncharacterized MAPEG superfamily protein
MHLHAALITLLTVLLLSAAMGLVGRARGRFKIQAPATTGHPDFERVFRAHQNTIEQAVMFLPALWLATLYGNEQVAAWLGYAWLVGRVWYLYGYVDAARSRSGGFLVASLAWIGLVLMGLWCVGARLIA